MKRRNNILSIIRSGFMTVAALSLLGGCDDSVQSSKPTTKPSVAIATTQPADASAIVADYPTRPPSMISIDGRDITFPAAKLAVINRGNGGFTLRLCSDDPPTAIEPGYKGNSYVLDMQLSIDRLSELPSANWDFKAAETDDANSGVFLHGYREQLRPSDVHATFFKDGDELITSINGTFLQTDANNPGGAPERVQVSGFLRTSFPAE